MRRSRRKSRAEQPMGRKKRRNSQPSASPRPNEPSPPARNHQGGRLPRSAERPDCVGGCPGCRAILDGTRHSSAAAPTPPGRPFVVRACRAGGDSTSAFKQLLPEQTGVEFINTIDTSHPRKYLYFSGTAGGGVAIGDVDADGWPDLYFVNGPGENRLYRQVERMRFEDVTDQAGVDGGDAWGTAQPWPT